MKVTVERDDSVDVYEGDAVWSWAIANVAEWREKAAELDALRGAGRVVPEGVSWPRLGDGGPVRLGGEAWTREGERVRVVAVTHRGKAAVRPWGRTDGRGARWVPLASLLGERPDSWGRLMKDARKCFVDYWVCGGIRCEECRATEGGARPFERYECTGCEEAMRLDLLARAERMAGVESDA